MSLPISDEHNSRHDVQNGELAVPCGRSKRSIPPETILAVYISVPLAEALKGSVYEKQNLLPEVRLKVMLLRYSERLDQTSHKTDLNPTASSFFDASCFFWPYAPASTRIPFSTLSCSCMDVSAILETYARPFVAVYNTAHTTIS